MPSEVRILHADTGATLRTIHPYGAFVGGVFVAAGDVTGDGYADIITGAGAGGGPHVQAFDGVSGATVQSFFAFAPSFTGGVRVAAGDVTGDGKAEIIAAAGPGGSPQVSVFDGATAALVSSMLAYPVGFTGGVFVATVPPQHHMVIEMAGTSTGGSGTVRADASPSGAPREGGQGGGDRRPEMVAGWAYIENQKDAGISTIHVWAVPVGGGSAIFVGVATLGDARPDVAAKYGAQYGNAGFHLDIPGGLLPSGTYDVAVYAQSAKTGIFQVARVIRMTKTP